ncbi:MAG: FxsA family protein [Paracoccaceae bacterium]
MWLLVAFLAVPLIEIALFIQVGGAIGLGWTLLIVVITAVLGAYMVRNQGAQVMTQVRQSFSEVRDPSEPLAHGAMILFAGALLLTPGFFTDIFGFLLLIPKFRSFAFTNIRKRVKVQSFSAHNAQHGGPQHRSGHGTQSGPQHRNSSNPDVIDGEYEDLEDNNHERSGSSGWTKH